MSIAFAQKFGVVLAVASSVLSFACDAAPAKGEWAKHVVHQGAQSLTAVAGDFTRDGQPDIIANAGEKTRLFVGPAWKEMGARRPPQAGWDRYADFPVCISQVGVEMRPDECSRAELALVDTCLPE